MEKRIFLGYNHLWIYLALWGAKRYVLLIFTAMYVNRVFQLEEPSGAIWAATLVLRSNSNRLFRIY